MNAQATGTPLLDAQVRLDSLPVTGRRLSVLATAEQSAAIAERLDLLAVDRFEAELTARPLKGGIEVSGTLKADVQQACVVTFESVPEHVEETLFRLFLHGTADESAHAAGAEIYVDLDGDDLPDYFDGPEADLSEWLVETLSLALDPYPRKPGVEVDPRFRDDGSDKDSPFGALKDLKTTKK